MRNLNREELHALTPEQALEGLVQGNKRFLDRSFEARDYNQEIEQTATSQCPHTAILSCIDSRVPAEIVFDQGIGSIFSVRIAGNVLNSDIIASLEFATKVVGSKLIVVLGHTGCGAVKGAVDGADLGSLPGLLGKISKVMNLMSFEGEKSSSNPRFLDALTEANVWNVVQEIPKCSPDIAELQSTGKIIIKGAIYDVKSGAVTFL